MKGGIPTPLQLGTGSISAPAFSFFGDPDTGIHNGGADELWFTTGNHDTLRITSDVLIINQAGSLIWGSSGVGGQGLVLKGNEADHFEQRRGANPQKYTLSNSYTDGSNYERGGLFWVSNELLVGSEAAGTGTARDVRVGPRGAAALLLSAGGTAYAQVSSDGMAFASTCQIRFNAVTATQWVANQNNFNVTGCVFLRVSTDASRNLTGIDNGLDGRVLFISNIGAQNVVIQNENAGSNAENRIITGLGADLTLAADKTVMLVYDDTSQRWRVLKNA